MIVKTESSEEDLDTFKGKNPSIGLSGQEQ